MASTDMTDMARRLVEPLRAWFLGWDSGYESGAWTPTFVGQTTPGTFTYTNTAGRYTRIGNLVLVSGRVALSAITVAAVGNLQLNGLPYTSTATGTRVGGLSLTFYTDVNLTAGYTQLGAFIAQGRAYANFAQSGDNIAGTTLTGAALAATTDISFIGQYTID